MAGPKEEKPPNFPMKFKVFLRWAFRGRSHAERLCLYRKFTHQYFAGESAAEVKTQAFIAKQSYDGIDDPTWFFPVCQDIAAWRKVNRIKQRKEAANSRWAKEKMKKPLDPKHQVKK